MIIVAQFKGNESKIENAVYFKIMDAQNVEQVISYDKKDSELNKIFKENIQKISIMIKFLILNPKIL